MNELHNEALEDTLNDTLTDTLNESLNEATNKPPKAFAKDLPKDLYNDFHNEIIDLQTRLAYQEDTITQLNDVITKQDASIIALQQQVRLLILRFEELATSQQYGESDDGNERPPHY